MASATSFPRQQPLLQLLQQTDGELSAQELHQRLRATRHSTGLATVYRVLKQLQQAGLVRCRKLPSGEAVYAPVDRDEHHLTCVQCGLIQALPICPISSGSLGLGAVLLQGFRPLFHTFEIHGSAGAASNMKSQGMSDRVVAVDGGSPRISSLTRPLQQPVWLSGSQSGHRYQ